MLSPWAEACVRRTKLVPVFGRMRFMYGSQALPHLSVSDSADEALIRPLPALVFWCAAA